jgi:hypothetical protein
MKWLRARASTGALAQRIQLSFDGTVAFRTFPFSAPSYEWKNVASPAGVVAFDCRKCTVADYFKAQHLSRYVRRVNRGSFQFYRTPGE